MPLYPSQTNQTPKTETTSSPTKQALIIITLTILLIIAWLFFSQLSYALLNLIIPLPEPRHSPPLFIPASLSTIQLGLLILFIYSLFLGLISFSGLFITNRFTRLIPIFLPPFTLILFITQINQLIITLFLASFFNFLFQTSVVNDLKLYKNFSLSRLVLPHTSYLFISLSLIIVLPIFFYFQTHSDTVPQLIQTKLIQPLTNQLISSLPIDQTSSDLQSLPDTAHTTDSSIIPPQFSHLIKPELLDQFQLQLRHQATQSAITSASPPSLIPDLKEFSLPSLSSVINPSQLSDQVQNQVTDQVNKILAPIYPFLAYIISFSLFFSIYQIVSLLRPIIFIIPWVIFHLCLQLKIAKITTQNEPVQKLIV